MIRIRKGLTLLLVAALVCNTALIFAVPAIASSPSSSAEAADSQSPSSDAAADPTPDSAATADESPTPEIEEPKVDVFSDYCILIDADTGTVLFEKNAHVETSPASTTKIMTGFLACELVEDIDEEIEIGEEVNGFYKENILIGLVQYERVTIKDLLYGAMLPSGNDAAAALAVHFGGSKSGFSELMNAKVKELGLSNTNFLNPHGLTQENHYTTAHDLAQITRAALQNELFAEVVSTPEYVLQKTNKRSSEKLIYNTNKFLTSKESEQSYHWSAVTGVKTGHTSAAQGCLVTSASKDGKNLIAVALHDTSNKSLARWDDCRKMLEFGFEEMDKLVLSDLKFDPISTTVVDASKKDSEAGILLLDLKTDGIEITGLREDLDKIKGNPDELELVAVINQGNDLVAPVSQGQVVGSCAIKGKDGAVLSVVDLVAQREVASIESDPDNPVSSLVTGVTAVGNNLSTTQVILIISAASIVIGIMIYLIVRRRSRHTMRFPSRKRRSGYFNYHQR